MINKGCYNCKHILTFDDDNPKHPCHTCRVPEYEVDNWKHADWVDVVRCKNCIHRERNMLYCRLLKIDIMPSQYCSLGEKNK